MKVVAAVRRRFDMQSLLGYCHYIELSSILCSDFKVFMVHVFSAYSNWCREFFKGVLPLSQEKVAAILGKGLTLKLNCFESLTPTTQRDYR